MSERQSKKLRQLYRRDLSRLAKIKYIAEFIKPRPRFIPTSIWNGFAGLFVDLKREIF